MRKEVGYAIIGGIILGLIVAFGVWRVNSTILKKGKSNITLGTPAPLSKTLGELKIVLDKPENSDVVTTDMVTVSGLTKPLSWITISGEESDHIIQSDDKGVFSQDVDLIAGVNQIKVTAFNSVEDNSPTKSSDTKVLVVYSSSFQTRTLEGTTTNNSATETSDIRAKVAANVANAVNHPKAYLGTVTDITDTTIEIKSMESEIKQISINSDSTSVTNSTGTTTKTVKTTDIAIGDFIVAMGYVNGNSVLAAQRILITSPITEPKINVSQAKVTGVTKKALTVNTTSDNKEDTVQPTSKTDILTLKDGKFTDSKLSDIEAENTVIYITTTDEKGNLSVRTIFVVS